MRKTTFLLLVLFALPALAHSNKDSRCTTSDIAGVYGFKGEGFIVAEGVGFPVGPLTTVGTITFNKDGTWRVKQDVSASGTLHRNVVFAGTYALNPDCTFSLFEPTVSNSAIDIGIFIADGKEFVLMPNLEGYAITFAGKRIFKARH
ncbi:hypothetical protein ATI61_103331 [Archangium gephyra]|uniref:Uncharacterized protein n=1 Tax=Archangium gephyra TaxID=48 RepID=A0ABX9K6S8_9BACT|nr:hypothetical protein [Archangium gephyra]REG34431.1 hypothetical protein ATI61_103331 [Archangium gephyra]